MKSPAFKSHDAYIAAQPERMQRILETVRETVRKAVPDAEEAISYGMPAFKLHGRVLLYFAGWAEHYAIYPGSTTALSEMQDELGGRKVSKGTIRFELTEKVPVKLITRIAKVRAKENADHKTAKSARR
ncbi:MAG: DUF1801 domain-containing protein [Hyphomicrobium sp.]|nr:DUF1801 domain-containing protein [Hyphomicrobium sp.]